jgi:hypothetical protein
MLSWMMRGGAVIRPQRRTPPAEVDRLLHWMPIVVTAADLGEWERKFCASAIARSRRGPWRPSAKQLCVMQRLVREFQERTMRRERASEEDQR